MKNCAHSQVNVVFEKYRNIPLLVTFKNGEEFVLEMDYELEEDEYGEKGIWLGFVVEAISGSHPKFFELYKPGGGLDIVECEISGIRNYSSGEYLYRSEQQCPEIALPKLRPIW